ncbi:bifunctional metallophosphatase/5'-nucleotidase [Undibacterium oligocarboniphilum]|uniref:Bifunctional metallophosphatase/5'-nucleotidase n=1 Tax=Undibacterium oligocarboniphilum TaxID=666702 RepID=A0A850QAA3_9BURK|nr:bifunctional metallophosphatase/5'-nucleotidase [Undibacterium oligocarboniphilum]MBC3870886.1 bifunctional metallophosphatase/5'-nucleotidase [Undibacterium oligocarboniphilum]NVO76491.1 bifunctional metallophosphatase/5'-nucleotidase [Undibacterium oligocarboniphilum]
MQRSFKFAGLLALSILAACTAPANQQPTTTITIFSINDFHGNLQAEQPVPYFSSEPDPAHPGQLRKIPAGGYAYLVAKLKERRAVVSSSILVGGGDLIGASPMGSALLKDEPVIEALNQMQLSVTAVGNHEFDSGTADLMRKIQGECPATGCAYAGFHGADYAYLGANVFEQGKSVPWLTPYVIRQVGSIKVGFVGVVTSDVPNLVAGDAVRQLHFADEVESINRYVPELKQQGVQAIVALIHEGAVYKGPENDPTYHCDGLQGPIIPIVKKLDKAVSLVISGHSHQGYTCKIDGRLVVQGRSYGAFLTESTLTLDRRSGAVVRAEAVNHLINQQQIAPDAVAQRLVSQVNTQTAALRQREVLTMSRPLRRSSEGDRFDSELGNLIADAQLHAARHQGHADLSLMNEGGIHNDLPSGQQVAPLHISFGDIYAVQPFGNQIVSMQLTGAQIMQVLQQQWAGGRLAEDPKKLYVSHGVTYTVQLTQPVAQRITEVRIAGKTLDLEQRYTVVMNSFLADGGDGFSILKQGTARQLFGRDLDAFASYLRERGQNVSDIDLNRVQVQR